MKKNMKRKTIQSTKDRKFWRKLKIVVRNTEGATLRLNLQFDANVIIVLQNVQQNGRPGMQAVFDVEVYTGSDKSSCVTSLRITN